MDCSGIADHLSPLVDGELESEKAESVRAHLATCPFCRKTFQDHMSVKQLLSRKLLFEKAPPGLRAALLDQLDSLHVGGVFVTFLAGLRARPLVATGLAAILLVAIFASVLLLGDSRGLPPLLVEVLDHYAEASQVPLEVVSADAGHLAQVMSRSVKRDIGVADLKSNWCFLMGARKCPRCRWHAVEIRYLHPAGNVSCFMFSEVGKKAIAKLCKAGILREKRVDGRTYLTCKTDCGRAVLWMEGDRAFVVVSDFSLPSVCPFRIAGEIRKVCRQQER